MMTYTPKFQLLLSEKAKILFLCLSLMFTSAMADLTPSFYAENSTLSATLQEDASFFAIEIYSKKAESLEPRPLTAITQFSYKQSAPDTDLVIPREERQSETLIFLKHFLITAVGNHSPPYLV